MNKNYVEIFAGVAISPSDHVDLFYTALAVHVRSEKLTEYSLNVVCVKLVVNSWKANRRDRDKIVGIHDCKYEMCYPKVFDTV